MTKRKIGSKEHLHLRFKIWYVFKTRLVGSVHPPYFPSFLHIPWMLLEAFYLWFLHFQIFPSQFLLSSYHFLGLLLPWLCSWPRGSGRFLIPEGNSLPLDIDVQWVVQSEKVKKPIQSCFQNLTIKRVIECHCLQIFRTFDNLSNGANQVGRWFSSQFSKYQWGSGPVV